MWNFVNIKCVITEFIILIICGHILAQGQTQSISLSDLALFYKDQHRVQVFYPDRLAQIILTTPKDILDWLLDTSGIHSEPPVYFHQENNLLIITDRRIETQTTDNFFQVIEKPYAKEESTVFIPKKEEDITILPKKFSQNGKLVHFGKPSAQNGEGKVQIRGKITEKESGMALVGAVVYNETTKQGVVTDDMGQYSITVPTGRNKLSFSSLGRTETKVELIVYESGIYNLEMEELVLSLKDITVSANRRNRVRRTDVGLEKLDIATIKSIPTTGEVDIMKAALLLPGVKTVGEGATGFNVRGGNVDQNLILLDNAPIYNSSHLFGFFSTFHPDAIQDFELYKGGIPAEYGGRASSVFDVSTRNGNLKKFSANGGLGIITGRLTIEGPVAKDKASFLLAGRTTYSNWLFKRFDKPSLRNSKTAFSDITAKTYWQINQKNIITLTAYYSTDYFKLNYDTTYNYVNYTGTLSYKHFISERHYAELNLVKSHYDYSMATNYVPQLGYRLGFSIDQLKIGLDFNLRLSSKHKIKYGFEASNYLLGTGSKTKYSPTSDVIEKMLEKDNGTEGALYISDEYSLTSKLLIYAGLRYSGFYYSGPKTVFTYDPRKTKEAENITDTTIYKSGSIIRKYFNPEPRLSIRYLIANRTSVKFTYNYLAQYLHLLTNSTAVSPTDIWKLSDTYIPPQTSNQVALGIYQELDKGVEISLEGYYKQMNNLTEYKGGAQLVMNETIETELLKATGKAYGLELSVKKTTGKLNGWLSYTWARTWVKAYGNYPTEIINQGRYFPSNFDKPHDLSILANYKFTRRLSLSTTFIYSTGRPITYPVARYHYADKDYVYYSARNEYRVPDYCRMDLSVTYEGNLNIRQLAHNSWTLAVYNLLGRNNIYSEYFQTEGTNIQGYRLSVIAQPIVSLTWNFKF